MDTIRYAAGRVEIIDQTRLPEEIKILTLSSLAEMEEAIAHLRVRGAPAIAVAAAYGLYLGVRDFTGDWTQWREECRQNARRLLALRPTAVNLAAALHRLLAQIEQEGPQSVAAANRRLREACQALQEEDAACCREIGRHGSGLLPPHATVITHCNAGRLATAGDGTALSIIYQAAAAGKITRVYVDETRPLNQGSRLTAWELSQSGLPVTVICDNMAATVLKTGEISCALVGSDRIAANGDVANKIGTLGLAILCRHFAVPFYVAAPSTTVDRNCPTGQDIPIEIRPEEEIRNLGGRKNVPDACQVFNPAFDVTPAGLVSAIITEHGVARPPLAESLAGLAKP